jgi:hypothetical protein
MEILLQRLVKHGSASWVGNTIHPLKVDANTAFHAVLMYSVLAQMWVDSGKKYLIRFPLSVHNSILDCA